MQVTDVEFSLLGMLFAVCAVLTTSHFQTWQGSKQKVRGTKEMACGVGQAGLHHLFGCA